jgi:hypothetical protein
MSETPEQRRARVDAETKGKLYLAGAGCLGVALFFGLIGASLMSSWKIAHPPLPPKTAIDIAYDKVVAAHGDAEARDFRSYEAAKFALKARLMTPKSLEMGPAWSTADGTICGAYDAENTFGARAGRSRFIYSGTLVLEEQAPRGRFEQQWANSCAPRRFSMR